MIPLRDENPTRRFAFFNTALIAACVAVFFWEFSLGPQQAQAAIMALGLVPDALVGGGQVPAGAPLHSAWPTLLTSMFLHGGLMHLAGNMLYLWIFGDNVEDRMGHGRYVLFYVLCGLAAALAQALPDPDSRVPMVGASGAISGVLGAYLVMFPGVRVLVLIPLGFFSRTVRLPALLVLGLWFALQLLSELAGPAGAGVAFRAHIGGFVAGMLLMPLFRRRAGNGLW